MTELCRSVFEGPDFLLSSSHQKATPSRPWLAETGGLPDELVHALSRARADGAVGRRIIGDPRVIDRLMPPSDDIADVSPSGDCRKGCDCHPCLVREFPQDAAENSPRA